METRANFVLIGAFTLLGIAGLLGFFVWLASVQIDRQYNVYGILFDDVSGLSASGDVQFNGISVGRVIGLEIYDADPGKVLARVEIDATTPIRENTVAQLMSQGVTGVAYVSLAGGPGDAPPLTAPAGELPIIPSTRSTVQALVEDAPDLLAQANALLRQLQGFVGPQNQGYVSNILRNADASSAKLDSALGEFAELSVTAREAADTITRFTERLDTLSEAVTTTLGNTDTTLGSATVAFDEATRALKSAAPAIDSATATLGSLETLTRERLPEIADQTSRTIASVDTAIGDLATRSGAILDEFSGTAGLVNARLTELEETLAGVDSGFVAVTRASDSFTALVDGDGSLLVAEAREVLAQVRTATDAITTAIDTDLPVVVADIRAAVATGAQAIDRIAADVTGFTGKLDPLTADAQAALAQISQIFERSGATLTALEGSLATADAALVSARTAFDSANDLLQTDLDPVLSDIRSAAANIDAAVAKVGEDLPAITADLTALIARADDVVAQVQSAVAASAPGISDFARTGLPELSRLGAESRALVRSLNDVVRRLGRDPAGFILQDRVPEYRR